MRKQAARNPFAYFLVGMTILACSMRLGAELNCSGGACPVPIQDGTALLPGIAFASQPNTGFWHSGPNVIDMSANGSNMAEINTAGFTLFNDVVSWNNDTTLARDSGNTLALKNGTTAQEFRNYLTTTGPVYTSILGNGITVSSGANSNATVTTTSYGFRGNAMLKDGTPTCSGAGCVVLANSVNSAGSVTTTTTGAADITITFSSSFQHAPVCLGDNATTGNLLRATQELVGSFHLQGITASGDTLGYVCIGN